MKKQTTASVILFLTALLGIALPSFAIFGPEGLAVTDVAAPETWSEVIQLLALGGCFTAAALYFPKKRSFLIAVTVISLIWCYLHVMLLPVLVSGLYFADLALIGRFLRVSFRNSEENRRFRANRISADLVLGISAVILLFCLLSAVHLAELWILRSMVAVIGVAVTLFQREDLIRMCRSATAAKPRKRVLRESLPRVEFLFCLTMILLQAARINTAIDYDTMWYGMRSQYVLLVNGSIYENPGLVGIAYVYSKGFETLMLPLSGLASHSYHTAINLWFLAAGIQETMRIAGKLAGARAAIPTALFTAATPAITNMALAAKPDIITWYVQLAMLGFFFEYLESGFTPALLEKSETAEAGEKEFRWRNRRNADAGWLILTASAFLLSLSLKPSALVFSTVMMGMMGLYLLLTGRLKFRTKLREWLAIVLSGAALIGIWARTWLITGMPVTSVFTSIFAKLGFELKYPFKVTSLPESYQSDPVGIVLIRRIVKMLIYPHGKDMNHVVIAWATALPLMIGVVILLSVLIRNPNRRKTGLRNRLLIRSFHAVFWPLFAVNLISLCMLYQIDGNYYILFYSMLILWLSVAFRKLVGTGLILRIRLAMLPMIVFAVFVTVNTNWAMQEGLTPIRLVNKGRVNERSEMYERMAAKGNGTIWSILAEKPETRCIAFGEHPYVLQFPCVMQAYKDITKPWGNVDLVLTPESFEEYMDYAKTEYVYAEREFFSSDEEEWNLMILRGLIASGCLDELYFENGNCLMKRVKEHVSPEKAQANLREFDEKLVKKAPRDNKEA